MKIDLNQIIEYFNKLNDQARYAILSGVVVLIILLDVFLLVLPQITGITDLNDQVKKMSEDTQEVLTDRQRIGQLKRNLLGARAGLDALSGRVRQLQEVPAILSTISSIANDYNVKIDQLIPEKGQEQTLSKSADGKYYALPIVIKVRCGYHMFGHFLNKLENADLYFILKSFIIESNSQDAQAHSFSMTINVVLVDRNMAPSKSL